MPPPSPLLWSLSVYEVLFPLLPILLSTILLSLSVHPSSNFNFSLFLNLFYVWHIFLFFLLFFFNGYCLKLYSEKWKGNTGKRERMNTLDKGPWLDSNPGFGTDMSRITEQPGAPFSLTFHAFWVGILHWTSYIQNMGNEIEGGLNMQTKRRK